ncbi:Cell division protein [Lachnospiraceae bacterium TWA4]|nr:Cell division protein [Lachnospiraceae bacterium TWA4]
MIRDLLSSISYVAKKIFTSRILVVFILLIVMFGTLILRLFNLQIVQGEDIQASFEEQTTTIIDTAYTRGSIYDKNGKILAYNKLAYNVEIIDSGDYDAYKRNLMIIDLIKILDAHGETINSTLSLALDDNEKFVFTTSTENSLVRFLKDIYGDEAYKKANKEASEYTAKEVIETLTQRYGVGYTDSRKKETYEINNDMLLKLLNIRYALALNRYQKYIPAVVASDVSDETVSDILEHEYNLLGVSIEQQPVRKYNDAKYFSHIIGYTGSINNREELQSFQKSDKSYAANDIVGKSGIEYSMESTLKGTKGSKTIIKDNTGTILQTQDEKPSTAGNDVYLTIDADLTKATYALIEQHLAGILVSKIVNGDYKITEDTIASKIKIPVKDVYYQLINNNILSMAHFASDEASQTERAIYSEFSSKREKAINKVCDIILNENKSNNSYSEEIQGYISYTYQMLKDEKILVTSSIDTSDSVYKEWENDTISFHKFLEYAISNSWIDVSKLNLTNKYSNSSETFENLVSIIRNNLDDDKGFNKEVYKYLIYNKDITGRQLCLALFDQAVLAYNESDYNKLDSNGEVYAYNFIKRKIRSLELTPAQLALDPCSASVIITDVHTGNVLSLVSYPSYDNNKITTDSSYWVQLNGDLSAPLYNRATQTKIAPGSIFKMITAFAGMEEGVIAPSSTITASGNGVFDKSNIRVKCAISPGSHGTLGIPGALEKSCNYFFCEVGYRLSQSGGKYNSSTGLANIQKYTGMFGLSEKTGIEISESTPHVTENDPVQSSIGQGSHAYTNTQMNRYLLTLASKGEVKKLNLVGKTTDSTGKTLKEYKKEVVRTLDFPNSEWNIVYDGMHDVVNNSKQYSSWFRNAVSNVTVAGKTGTAQENKKRGNHANFISFAPYDNPEISVSVSIPYGYTAANAVSVAKDVMKFYFTDQKLEDVLEQDGSNIDGVSVND